MTLFPSPPLPPQGGKAEQASAPPLPLWERGEGREDHPTLVVGLGNPLLGDDGVGWRVAEQVRQQAAQAGLPVEVDCLAVGGLSLMERMVGYRQAVVIDAITTGQQPLGSVRCLSLDDLPDRTAGHLGSAHDASLPTALQTGRALGAALPEQVLIVAVEAQQVYDFSDELTPPVAAAVPHAVQAVLAMLGHSTEA